MVGARRCTLGGSNAAEGSRQVPDVTRCHNRTEIYPITIFMAPTMLRIIASGEQVFWRRHEIFNISRLQMRECVDSGEDASVNAVRFPEKLGCNITRRPKAGGWYCTPISKDEDRIHRYARARVNVITLLYGKHLVIIYKPQKKTLK